MRVPSVFYLKTLGQLCLRADGPQGRALLSNSKPLALLAVLATMPDQTARRDRIAELLWEGSDTGHARRSLRQALHYLSRRVEEPLIEATDAELKLRAGVLEVDLWEFERAVKAGEYDRAVTLYAGPFVPGLERKAGPELEHWIESQDEQLRAGLEAAYAQLIGDTLENGDADTAVGYARRYVELNPLNEKAQLALVRSLKAARDRAGALQAYRSYRTLLKQVLDGEPSDELERAVAGVRAEVMQEPRFRLGARPLHRRSRRKMMRWSLTSAATGAALAAVVIASVLAVWAPWRDPDGLLAGLSGELIVKFEGRGSSELGVVKYRGARIDVERPDLGYVDVPSPAGSLMAVAVPADSGWNLALLDRATGAIRTLTAAADDEEPRDWSPDGRFILYRKGVPRGGATDYTNLLMAYDLETDSARLLDDTRAGGGYSAAWSPDGTQIAFVANPDDDQDIFVSNADGSNATRVVAAPGKDLDPAWSPDGRRLAFSSTRNGGADIFTVRPNGSDLHQITDAPADELTPVWLSATVIAFVMVQPDGSRDLWAVDINSRELRRVTENGGIYSVRWVRRAGDPSWIERLSITPSPELVSPGQVLELGVELASAAGRVLDPTGLPISWSAADSAIAGFVGPGRLKVYAPGRTRVVASAGGWVADTLEIESRELVPGEAALIFFEDWTGGLRPERWVGYGRPLPETRPIGGPEGAGVFLNNGDQHFPSGALSKQAFSPRAGLTLEVWARMPFTGKLYQCLAIGLTDDDPPADSLSWRGLDPHIEFYFVGPSLAKSARLIAFTDGAQTRLPMPDTPEAWHLYALQLDPDGTVSLLIDGRLYWRSPTRLDLQALGPLRIKLGDRSFETEIAHGVLRLYYGSRYSLPRSREGLALGPRR
ncbi:MAG: BTAD domain-containing putative transcriptional regulator [Gemmatimonadales bacterium]|jgi:TolB protein